MNFEALDKIFQKCYDPKEQKFIIESNVLDSFNKILASLKVSSLELTKIENPPEVYHEIITVQGVISILGVESASTIIAGEIIPSETDGEASIALTVKNFGAWDVKKFDPKLPESFIANEFVIESTQSLFYEVILSKVHFVVTSHPYYFDGANLPQTPESDDITLPGIHIVSDIDFSSSLKTQSVLDVLPELGNNNLLYRGLIVLPQDERDFSKITILRPLTDFNVSDIWTLKSPYHVMKTELVSGKGQSTFKLAAHVAVGSNIYLTAELLQGDEIWGLGSQYGVNVESGNIAKITEDLFQENLANIIPLPKMLMSATENFGLQSLTAGYLPDDKHFLYFGFELGIIKPWIPYSQLSIDKFTLSWALNRTADSKQFSFVGDFFFTFNFGDLDNPDSPHFEIDMTGSIPVSDQVWRLMGSIDFTEDNEDKAMPLSDVFNAVLPSDIRPEYPGVFNHFGLYTLAAYISPGEDYYEFESGVSWTLNPSAKKEDQTVFDLYWDLNLSTKNGFSLSGGLSGYLEFGSQKLNILEAISELAPSDDVGNPQGMNLILNQAGLVMDVSQKTLMITAVSDEYGDAALAVGKSSVDPSKWRAMFGVATAPSVQIAFDLSNMPLIGGKFSLGRLVFNHIRLTIATEAFDLSELNRIVPANAQNRPSSFSTQNAPKGLSLTAEMSVGGETFPVFIAVKGEDSAFYLDEDPQTPTQKKTDWQKTALQVGPLQVHKIGPSFQSGALGVKVDASLALGPMQMDLYGFSVGSSIQSFSPKLYLEGLGLNFAGGPIQIQGHFVSENSGGSLSQDAFQFYGNAQIKAAGFNLSASAIYTKSAEVPDPSFFIYVALNRAFGGPPVFFVNGISVGFAYNFGLNIPDIDALSSFPLIQAAQPGAQSEDPISALKSLKSGGFIQQQSGENWLAAGIRFSSFEVVKSFALVTTGFGNTAQVNLLGTSTLILPKGAAPDSQSQKPIVRAQMNLLVTIDPNEQAMRVDAKLTPASYVIDPQSNLSGGFAFYTWFGGEKQGDFVISLGGYSPFFTQKPAHYPEVPRLSLSWQLNQNLSITGMAYLALTPTCAMTGGRLTAIWKSGSVQAWFVAYADLFLSWEPYRYIANVGVSIGVSARLKINFGLFSIRKTFRLSLGADLYIEGPAFYVKARVRLWFISFTITAGSPPGPAEFIDWPAFANSFLPAIDDPFMTPLSEKSEQKKRFSANEATKTIIDIHASSGVIQSITRTNPDTQDESIVGWVVNPVEFELVSSSVIPSKTAAVTSWVTPTDTPWNCAFGVGPMGFSEHMFDQFKSTHEVIIQNAAGESPDLDVQPNMSDSPRTLWGDNTDIGNPDFNRPDQTISNTLSGFTFKSIPPVVPEGVTVNPNSQFFEETEFAQELYNPVNLVPQPVAFPDDPAQEIKETIKDNTDRSAILAAAINDYAFDLNVEVNVQELYTGSANLIQYPQLRVLGQEGKAV